MFIKFIKCFREKVITGLILFSFLIIFAVCIPAQESVNDTSVSVKPEGAAEENQEIPQENQIGSPDSDKTDLIEQGASDASPDMSPQQDKETPESDVVSNMDFTTENKDTALTEFQTSKETEVIKPVTQDNIKIKRQTFSPTQVVTSSPKQRYLAISKMRVVKSRDDWMRSFVLGIDTARGNSDILRYNSSLNITKEDDKNYYWFKMSGRYGESNEIKDTENTMFNAKYEHLLRDYLYSSFDAEIYHDSIADLSYRNRYNVSLGKYMIKTESAVFQAEAGPGYLQESKGGETDNFLAARFGYYGEVLMNANVILRQSSEYIVNLDDTNVYYLNINFEVETYFLNNMSLKIEINNRYDNTPIPDKENSDLITSSSLSWQF